MDELLSGYVRAIMQDKINEALRELNRAIDAELGDEKVKHAAFEYARHKSMLNQFDEHQEDQ